MRELAEHGAAIVDALAGYLRSLGGEIETGHWVNRIADLPSARATFFDVTPDVLMRIAGDLLPRFYRSRLQRFRKGPGAFKVDYALSERLGRQLLAWLGAGGAL